MHINNIMSIGNQHLAHSDLNKIIRTPQQDSQSCKIS